MLPAQICHSDTKRVFMCQNGFFFVAQVRCVGTQQRTRVAHKARIHGLAIIIFHTEKCKPYFEGKMKQTYRAKIT